MTQGALALLLLSLLIGCQPSLPAENVPERVFFGEQVSVGNGFAVSFVKHDGPGQPASLGIILSKSALEGLPAGMREYTLALPGEAARTPFNHVTLDWNPQGHGPPQVYDVPHFDVHFYLINGEQRNEIRAENAAAFARAPPASSIPQSYRQAPGGVPRMGAHWIDANAPELRGEPFTATFIYGSYDREVIFYEPMVAKAFLEQRRETTREIPQPESYPKAGFFYPTMHRVAFDNEAQQHLVVLEGLRLH